ncbi:hypothetical protein CDEST_04384 [Colletotrichum destructivum]|uniref:Secreted protein n=1 Tax=Colletotrichum destructivum TaxID=34406 RepID=A0AAX4I7U3_9PEZI|nr:hypothetical protein CDEST_04384 [Colletotrichum destructivum]
MVPSPMCGLIVFSSLAPCSKCCSVSPLPPGLACVKQNTYSKRISLFFKMFRLLFPLSRRCFTAALSF